MVPVDLRARVVSLPRNFFNAILVAIKRVNQVHTLHPTMSRLDTVQKTDHANVKQQGPSQALGSWKEYEAFKFPFPMHQAALFDDTEAIAEYLHSKNGCYRIDINALDDCGRTIAHICAMESHVALLAFVLARRPNLEIKDCDVGPFVWHSHSIIHSDDVYF
jgi:hypothetical protein